MTYWVVADSYGYKLAVQAGTTFRLAYCRFITPFSSPAAFPFPLAIGGDSSNDGYDYATQNSLIRFCADPAYQGLNVMLPGGSWSSFSNYGNNPNTTYVTAGDFTANIIFPFGGAANRYIGLAAIRPNFEGEYMMFPLLISAASNDENIGEFEGLFFVPGYNTLAAGDVIQHGGDDHIVVQNIHRNGDADHVAMRLA
jgi:hypothetical protein